MVATSFLLNLPPLLLSTTLFILATHPVVTAESKLDAEEWSQPAPGGVPKYHYIHTNDVDTVHTPVDPYYTYEPQAPVYSYPDWSSSNEVEIESGPSQTYPYNTAGDKTWNVPAPYIAPNPNPFEDVGNSVGVILVIFIIGVLTLGAIAHILTTKTNSSVTSTFGRDQHVASSAQQPQEQLAETVLKSIEDVSKKNE